MAAFEPGMGELARSVLAAAHHAALATREPEGAPFASLVTVATDAGGAPLLLLSGLARHTRNIAADPRVALLVAAPGENPMASPRLTISGIAVRCEEPEARERFLAHHPAANAYAGFADFALWRLAPLEAHLVAGFGRIHDLPAVALAVNNDADPAAVR